MNIKSETSLEDAGGRTFGQPLQRFGPTMFRALTALRGQHICETTGKSREMKIHSLSTTLCRFAGGAGDSGPVPTWGELHQDVTSFPLISYLGLALFTRPNPFPRRALLHCFALDFVHSFPESSTTTLLARVPKTNSVCALHAQNPP